jgi:hypothetical protein
MERIRHIITGRPGLVGLFAAIATLAVAACNNGTGGGPAY